MGGGRELPKVSLPAKSAVDSDKIDSFGNLGSRCDRSSDTGVADERDHATPRHAG